MEDNSPQKNGFSRPLEVQNSINSNNKSITDIPEQYFEEILAIWDIFTCCAEIINDILIQTEGEEGSELRQVGVNIGNVAHFERFFKDYFLQISIVDLFECFNNPEQNHFYSDLLLFLCSFYLKQIFEDSEQENQNIKMHNNCLYTLQYQNCEILQKGSLWQLLYYLWYRDKEAYFKIIQEKVYELPVEIQEYGILHLEEDFNELKLDNSLDERLSLVKTIADGIMDLKRTSALLQFRTENILLANRQRQSLSKDIRDKRGKLAEIAEEICIKEQAMKELVLKIEQSEDLTRLETCRINKQIEGIQKEIQKQKNLSNKEQNNMDDLQEQYDSLQKLSSYQMMPQLLHNPSIYLGSDLKESHYYFFLHENSKILFKLKSGLWSFIQKQEQIEQLIRQLNSYLSCEQNLKQNLQNLLKYQIYNDRVEVKVPVEEQKNILTQDAEFPSSSIQLRKRIINQTLMIEAELSDYLAKNRSRWINLEERKIFRQRFHSAIDQSDAQFLENVSELLSKFLERTVVQEKLEIREYSDNEVEESDAMEIEDERDYNNTKNQEKKNRRRVVEDESDETYNNPVYNNQELQHLEQLDPQKLIIKKIPLRLFGAQNDLLRQCCIDLAKSSLASLADLMLLITVIEKTVQDCLERKKEKIQHPQVEFQKQKQEIPQQIQTTFQAPQLKTTSIRTTRSKQKLQTNGVETQWEELCKVCHQRGKLICCDTCPSVFHSKCLGLKQIPQGKWSCFRCLSRMEAQIKTRATLKKLQQ